MKIDGGCHCGRIRYEAEVEADRVIVCHCSDCQTLSGSAFRVVVQTRPGTFRLLSGTPKVYTKRAESGAAREQGFCPDCGAPIFSRPAGQPASAIGLRVGTITQRHLLIPKAQYWTRSAQSWLAGLPDIPASQTQPAFGPDGSFRA
jgi:hypothetical protein